MTAVYEQVTDDLYERMRRGMEEYGQPFYPYDGGDTLRHAYEELLDYAIYLRKYLHEASGDHTRPYPEIGHLVIEDVRNGWAAADPEDFFSGEYERVLRALFQWRAQVPTWTE